MAEDERDRPMWPWIVAALFVVAAAIAGIVVWNQLSSSAPQETVGFYSDCLTEGRAVRQIKAAHLVPQVKEGTTMKCDPGQVYDQDPGQGGTLPKGSTVTIWVSTGKPKVEIPRLVGQTWADASKTLKGLDLKPVQRVVPGGTKGLVTGTSPAAGQVVTVGDTVKVNVAAGPQINAVPSVVGEPLQQAIDDLHAAGFNANPSYVDNNAPAGTVVSQDPAPGEKKPAGTYVKVNVSNGPPQTTVPSVIGETSKQAEHDLKAAGFNVVKQYVSVSDATQDDLVQSQTPAGNSQAPERSTVTIYIGRFDGTTTATTTTGQ